MLGRMRAILGLVTMGMLVGACVGAQQVPAVAPDSVPTTLFDDADLIELDAGQLVSTSILVTLFDRAATQAERQAAVDRVDGRVIGGFAFAGDGVYLIRVPGDSTWATIDSLGVVMQSLPQVTSAGPFNAGGVKANN